MEVGKRDITMENAVSVAVSGPLCRREMLCVADFWVDSEQFQGRDGLYGPGTLTMGSVTRLSQDLSART